MRRIGFRLALLLFSFFSCLSLPGKGENPLDGLPGKYKKWLEEEVVYVITPRERDIFLQLATDSERDIFIKAFWKHRDPTAGTPENEFRNEHYQRIEYANCRFGLGSPKPGWKTDRGRIYIILGEPGTREIFTNQRELRDTEIWFYQDMAKLGLRTAFHVVFFRKSFGEDFELYSPAQDGPMAFFMQTPQFDPVNYLVAYEQLKAINPTIADVSLSLIPGESSTVSGRPSLASELLLQNIYVAPQKSVNDLYAQKLLQYKGIVEVEYSINYIASDYLVQVVKDDSGTFFVHYLVEPERLSVGQHGGTYYSHFVLNGMVSDLEGNMVYQFEKEYSLNLDKDKIQAMNYTPYQIDDMFPLIPGKYKFSLLVKNTVSKEFSSFEKDIFIPESFPSPAMGQLLLCYGSKEMNDAGAYRRPFQIAQHLLSTQPKNIFLPSEKMTAYFQLYSLSPELRETGKLYFYFLKEEDVVGTICRNVSNYEDPANITEEFPLMELSAAYYSLKVSLQNREEQELASQSCGFSITPATGLVRPLVSSKALPATSDALINFQLGTQLFNKKEYEKASLEYEKAVSNMRGNMDFAIYLAKTYVILERYDDLKPLLMPFLEKENAKYEVYYFLGLHAQAKKEFKEAIRLFREAISHFGVNIYLLNAIGECYFRLNDLEEARAVWEKSLEMNPDQPQVQKNLDLIKINKETVLR